MKNTSSFDSSGYSSDFLKTHPFHCELPDGNWVHFSPVKLNFFDVFFIGEKYPHLKEILNKFCEEEGFVSLQNELMAVLNQIDVDIRRNIMSNIIGTFEY